MALVELAEQGADLRRAAEYEKIYSSSHPSLLIAARLKIRVTGTGSLPTIRNVYGHGLGYAPVFIALNDTHAYDTGLSGGTDEDGDEIFQYDNGSILVDEVGVWVAGSLPPGAVRHFIVYLFYRDLEESYRGPILQATSRGRGAESAAKVRLLRNNRGDIESTDLRDFSFHERTRALPIHISGVIDHQVNLADVTTIEHGLGYAPLFWTYYSAANGLLAGKYQQQLGLPNSGAATAVHEADAANFLYSKSTAGKYAYIIFKDPIV